MGQQAVNQNFQCVIKLDAYRHYFSPLRFWKKLSGLARELSSRTVYSALLLYYAYERKDTPKWAKRVILGALGYLLMPIDAVPDLTPILGYTDDVTVLAAALTTVAAYINDEVKQNARTKLSAWIPESEQDDLKQIDDKV